MSGAQPASSAPQSGGHDRTAGADAAVDPTPRRPGRRWRARAKPLLAVLLLGLVVALVDPSRVGSTLRQADGRWAGLGLLALLAGNLASALRWRALCAWMGMAVPRGWTLRTYFHGAALNVVVPGAVVGGDVMRAAALQGRGHGVLPASLSVLGDRLSGLWLLLAQGVGALAWGLGTPGGQALAERWPLIAQLASAPLLVAILVAMLLLPWGLLRLAGRLAGRTAPAMVPGMTPDLLADSAPSARPGLLRRLAWLATTMGAHPRAGRFYAGQCLRSWLVQALSVSTLGCAALAVGVPLEAWMVAAAAVPITLMATLPISHGGWGTREAAAVISLAPLGVEAPQAVAMSVICGLLPVAQAVLTLAVEAVAGLQRVRVPR